MKRPKRYDPYKKALEQLNKIGVRYVVVGMNGINYYAKNPAETFATLHYDIFLEPTITNVKKAIEALEPLHLTLGTAEGPFNITNLRHIVRDQKTIIATTDEGIMIELLLKISGYPFSEVNKDAATFLIENTPVRAGRLQKLLQSKRLANRPKDRQFLKRYRSLLEETD